MKNESFIHHGLGCIFTEVFVVTFSKTCSFSVQEGWQPLFLGVDVLQKVTEAKNRGRVHARYIGMRMATRLEFAGKNKYS
jgi:hypothetical protein